MFEADLNNALLTKNKFEKIRQNNIFKGTNFTNQNELWTK